MGCLNLGFLLDPKAFENGKILYLQVGMFQLER